MRKLAFTLILVSSISLLTLNAFGGDLEPSEPPGPTMHSLNEIYDQIVQNAVPRYEYKYFEVIDPGETVTIHNGSGVVHSIVFGDPYAAYNCRVHLIDGNDIICNLYNRDRYSGGSSIIMSLSRVVCLNISYKNSLKFKNLWGSGSNSVISMITVVYKPDN